MRTLLELSQVGIEFPTPRGPFRALANVNLKIREGEYVSLIGHSGCGKSTVLNIVAGLLQATTGGVVLAGRERLELLPELERLYSRLWNAHRGVVQAEALTVDPLSEAQRTRLAQALGRLTGREVELTALPAPEILGGLVVRMDGKVYDGSVRGRLRALRERLVGEAQGA